MNQRKNRTHIRMGWACAKLMQPMLALTFLALMPYGQAIADDA
jgi:hypothetical protein